MKIMGISAIVCLGLGLANLGSDLSSWACSAALVFAILNGHSNGAAK